MDELQKVQIRARGVLLASGGLATALLLILGVKGLGITGTSMEQWALAAGATAAVQGGLFVVALRGWDRPLRRWDPHFLFTPLLGAMLLLGMYMIVAPEIRFIILLGWFVALLFMVGLGGFHAVVVLSGIMTLAYFAVSVFLYREGYPLSLTYEAGIAGSVFIISMYAGVVFERLRHDRLEMRELRRRLADMALTDPLTQLPNRRHFEEVLRAELDRISRYGGQCTVAMVDVDAFKHYNDNVGHLAGDIALRELSDVMRRELRLHDMVARFGGEEFALIMINASKEEALPVLERLRLAVQEHPFRNRDTQPEGRLTVSAGMAAFPADGTTYDDLLKKADDALYQAKREGRNRVVMAPSRQALDQPA
ncbi:MAG TPA: GGDEF domain-containing protein [Longimicrobiales bacterium]|nr:GGDEF domain-containing protein [Longimicrobiales bacterium]